MSSRKLQLLSIGLLTFGLIADRKSEAQEVLGDTPKSVRAQADAQLRSLQSEVQKELSRLADESDKEKLQSNSILKTLEILNPAGERVLGLVQPNAADKDSIDDLIWVTTSSRGSITSDAAADLLMAYHPTDRRTIELAYRHKSANLSWVRPLLKTQLSSNELIESDQARVLFALATQSHVLSEIPAVMNELSEGELHVWDATYSANWLARMRSIDVASLEEEAIELYNELRHRFGSKKAVQDVDYTTLANSAIFAIQNLSVGKLAPDIVGPDLDGANFKLSDYRGKVVLLSFWGAWCSPCMVLIPHEKELVSRLSQKPFVLIGVNSDPNKKDAEALEIPWRSFWCGEKGPLGEIPMAWSIRGWPKMFAVDHNGFIRAKHTTGTDIDKIIDRLLSEIEPE